MIKIVEVTPGFKDECGEWPPSDPRKRGVAESEFQHFGEPIHLVY